MNYCFQEMEEIENNLRIELENVQIALDAGQSDTKAELAGESKTTDETGQDTEESKSAILDKLENKKKELVHCTFLFDLEIHLTDDFFLGFLIIQNLFDPFRVQWKRKFTPWRNNGHKFRIKR